MSKDVEPKKNKGVDPFNMLLLLPERARSECARSKRALDDRPDCLHEEGKRAIVEKGGRARLVGLLARTTRGLTTKKAQVEVWVEH